jgi:methionine-rich copper-binding protein CopC
MIQFYVKRSGLVTALLLFALTGVLAETLQVVKSNPASGAVISSDSNQFEILFNGQIDTRHSTLTITRDGQVVETLHPSLDAAVGVLFARGPRLQQGSYKLHWMVKSLSGSDVTEGDIPFTVKS